MKQAIASRRHTTGLSFPSDRGSQYGSRAFRDNLRLAGMRQSMSTRANPCHNAWTESFMGTLKASTPPSTSELPATSRLISPSVTKSLWVQLSVASQAALQPQLEYAMEGQSDDLSMADYPSATF